MDGFVSDSWLYLLLAVVAGTGIGWLIRNALSNARIGTLNDDWQTQVDGLTRQRDRLTAETNTLRTTIEAQEALVARNRSEVARMQTELESAHEKEKLMTKNIFTLKAEREDFKGKIATFQNALATMKKRSAELQNEFVKSGNFYKSELAKSFEKRKAVELKLENSRSEYESFRNLLQASRSEQESVSNMLSSAQARLADLDALENKVIALEAENAQLKHDGLTTRQENDALRRDLSEQEDLKLQNKELARVLKSVENSRKQYEEDANRYREHADQSEQQSETLRIRLDEVEENFRAMEKQQKKALAEARQEVEEQKSNGIATDQVDNLQEIVGIGKVFEHTLHKLGVFSFRQIVEFDVADIARVNAELKEFKGRMEQDDWIGQAKELHYKKYGSTH